MSALPPKADIETQSRDVRFVPKADILHRSKDHCYSITSSAVASNECGILNSEICRDDAPGRNYGLGSFFTLSEIIDVSCVTP
jgi:hypothetical protein